MPNLLKGIASSSADFKNERSGGCFCQLVEGDLVVRFRNPFLHRGANG
jgi:hypothetical protein